MKKTVLAVFLVFITVSLYAQGSFIRTENTTGDKFYVASLPKNNTNNYHKLKIDVFGGNWYDWNLGTRTYSISSRSENTSNPVRISWEQHGGATGNYTLKVYETTTGYDFVIQTTGGYVSILVQAYLTSAGSTNITNNTIQEVKPYTVGSNVDITTQVQSAGIYTTDNNGNIGIGTSNPRALLDIGNLSRNKLKSVLARSDEGNNDGEGTYLGVKTYNTQPSNGESYNKVKSFAIEHKFYGQINNSVNFYRGGGYTGGSIGLAVDDGKEIARFHSTGLNLAGTINARQVNITVSAGADHVFYPDYALMPLSEVESFVKENKHLPDIPSEKQMVENGLNVNEMQIKLLQKIEELTLYVIEQDKQIKSLKTENREIKSQLNNK